AEREERDLRSRQALLDDKPRAGRAELPLVHRGANRAVCFRPIARDDHALPRGEAVRLQHHGESEFARGDERARGVGRFADAITRSWNAVARHEPFREHFAALEPGGGARRPEDASARGAEPVDDTALERKLRTNDGEID